MIGFLIKRPIVWGTLAAVVLALDHAGMLDGVVAQARAFASADAPKAVDGNAAEDMARAETEARKFLPRFLAQAVRDPDAWEKSAVLVHVSEQGQSEKLWVEGFAMMGEGFEGRLTYDAQMLGQLKAGDTVAFAMEDIVDWAYVEAGVGFGYFTIHASLPYMPQAQASVTERFLHEVPLPKGW